MLHVLAIIEIQNYDHHCASPVFDARKTVPSRAAPICGMPL
ncbi:MAG TPA: hypothetical protein VFT23_17665 [Burkholderiales bacterium]|nr:hypothetical protein [Burkholderiales bacterium]